MNYPKEQTEMISDVFDSIQGAGHHPGSECIRYCIPQCRSRVGESPLLHCYCPGLGYVKQVTTCHRRSKLTTSRHWGEKTAKFLEIVGRTSRNTSPRRQQDLELYPPLDRKPVQIIRHLSPDVWELSSSWLISDQEWTADFFCPLLYLPIGTLFSRILVPQIHYLLSEVYSRLFYIKSLFCHSYQQCTQCSLSSDFDL